ncbi:MAG: hypothetical protein QUT30_04495, partial [Acidobacteriota bacterium]|nr:hypothetical protein [Acidobacteriota bacterium]
GVLIWIIPLAAEEKSLNIALKIVQDGADKQPPDNITIAFDGRSIQLPVRNGVFKAPLNIDHARAIAFKATLGKEQITIAGIAASVFQMEPWTIFLAERSYGANLQYAIPSGTDIRASCVLVFDSQHSGGWSK